MSHKLIIILSALAFGFGIALWDTNPPTGLRASEKIAVENFAFTSLDGENHTLSDFRGKTVFVNSWFTYCPPCTTEMPEFLKLAQKHPEDMVFIALSVDKRKSDIERYFDRLPEEIRNLTKLDNVFFALDEGKIITRTMLRVRSFPETIIIDKNGQQSHKINGVIDWLGPEVEKIFSEHTHESTEIIYPKN